MTSVDLVQVHALDAIDLDFVLGAGGAVGELERIRDEGKLRAIVSGSGAPGTTAGRSPLAGSTRFSSTTVSCSSAGRTRP